MQTDIYTKTVLTVIAISSTIIAVQNSIPNALAQQNNRPVKVIVCDPQFYYSDALSCASVDNNAIRVHKTE